MAKPDSGKELICPAEQHRMAFEVYYNTRVYSTVAQKLGVSYQTPFRWASKDYKCLGGCPWHGWDDLIKERDAAMQTRLDLLEQGEFSPIIHEAAMTEAIKHGTPTKIAAMNRIIRSDLERLTHWELLYAKCFYDATGIAIDFRQLKEQGTDIANLYEGTLRITSMEGAIRALQNCQLEIDKIRGRVHQDLPQTKQVASSAPKADISITDLRELRKKLDATPSDIVKVIATQVIMEKGQVQ